MIFWVDSGNKFHVLQQCVIGYVSFIYDIEGVEGVLE